MRNKLIAFVTMAMVAGLAPVVGGSPATAASNPRDVAYATNYTYGLVGIDRATNTVVANVNGTSNPVGAENPIHGL
jgi:hypothetical protein